jgi:hypothetical protein
MLNAMDAERNIKEILTLSDMTGIYVDLFYFVLLVGYKIGANVPFRIVKP